MRLLARVISILVENTSRKKFFNKFWVIVEEHEYIYTVEIKFWFFLIHVWFLGQNIFPAPSKCYFILISGKQRARFIIFVFVLFVCLFYFVFSSKEAYPRGRQYI